MNEKRKEEWFIRSNRQKKKLQNVSRDERGCPRLVQRDDTRFPPISIASFFLSYCSVKRIGEKRFSTRYYNVSRRYYILFWTAGEFWKHVRERLLVLETCERIDFCFLFLACRMAEKKLFDFNSRLKILRLKYFLRFENFFSLSITSRLFGYTFAIVHCAL